MLAARSASFSATSCLDGGRPDHGKAGLGELEFFTLAEVAEMAQASRSQDASTLAAYALRLCARHERGPQV